MITGAINDWIGQLFTPENRDATVRALVESQGDPAVLAVDDAARRRLAEAETALKRYQAAIAAGVEPAAVVDAINQARAERDAARARLAQTPAGSDVLEVAEVYAMVDALGDVGSVIERARPEPLARLYRELDLDIRYRPPMTVVRPHLVCVWLTSVSEGGIEHEFVASLRQAGVHAVDDSGTLCA